MVERDIEVRGAVGLGPAVEDRDLRSLGHLRDQSLGVIGDTALRRRHGREKRDAEPVQRTSSIEKAPTGRGTLTSRGVRAGSRAKYTSDCWLEAGPFTLPTSLSVMA